MTDVFFHCTPAHLEVGSVLKPGNWGRILKRYGRDIPGSWEVLYREMCLEYVRKLEFADKPSRMDSLFLCRSKEDMDFFKFTATRPIDIVYKVRVLDSSKPIHRANWKLVSPENWGQQPSIITSMEDAARQYWNGGDTDHGQFTECLVESPVEVVEIYT